MLHWWRAKIDVRFSRLTLHAVPLQAMVPTASSCLANQACYKQQQPQAAATLQ
jgi:hypothetical protein